MSTVHGQPIPEGTPSAHPYGPQPSPRWPGEEAPGGGSWGSGYGPAGPGYGGPGGPGSGGPGYGGAPGGPGASGTGRPHRRFSIWVAGIVAVVAAAAGSAVAAGMHGSAASPVLTTSQIAAAVNPGIVDVTSRLGYQRATSAGTGIVLTPSGEVLTNNHVVRGATAITATDVDTGRTYRAVVTGYDQKHDIAVLQLQGASGLKTVDLGDSSKVSVGQKVVALGNAGGRGGVPSVAEGRVTGLNQSITATDASAGTAEQLSGLIRTNANVQPGDSGGPLVNTAGQVIGIDTAGSATPGFEGMGQAQAQPNSFAIPINQANAIADQIEAHQSSATVHIGATAFLGVQVLPADSAGTGGAALGGVVAGTPAAQTGLTAGDVITSVGGHQVTSPDSLQAILGGYHPGERVSVGWTDQAGQSHTATLTLAKGPVG